MHFGHGVIVRFANNGENGGKLKVFEKFVGGGRHDVGGIYHGSMPDDEEIKISNN